MKKSKDVKNDYGGGSCYQRKDGLFVASSPRMVKKDGSYGRIVAYGKTKAIALNNLTLKTNQIYNIVNDSEPLLKDAMLEWLMTFHKAEVTSRTLVSALGRFKNYICPLIGKMKVKDINHVHLQKLVNYLLYEKNYSLDNTKKTKFLLNQFYSYAIDNGLTETNPTLKVKIKSREKHTYDGEKIYKAIPANKRKQFLISLNDNLMLKALCMIIYFSGLRIGEVLSLTWGDINFKNRTINIDRAITIDTKFDDSGNTISRKTIISDTKTCCSVRESIIPEILAAVLLEYKEYRSKLCRGSLVSDGSLLFCHNDGRIRTYDSIYRVFIRFLKNHNLNNCGIHLHGLRHTFSNTLFEAKENPKIVQALLGHKSLKTTMTVYNSIDKSSFPDAIQVFDELYKTVANL